MELVGSEGQVGASGGGGGGAGSMTTPAPITESEKMESPRRGDNSL